MDMSELRTLLTPEALRMLDALGPIASTDAAARAVMRLRAEGHSPEFVSAVVGQARLRTKAMAKFGEFAERMLFTRAGLEQATRLGVAARHAGRMRAAGIAHVSDLGCGIGGDALAFAGAGLGVTAVDADEVTAALAAYNLAPFGSDAEVRHGFAEDHAPAPSAASASGSAAVWLDPARRTAGHSETRRVAADDYSPSLDWAFALAEQIPTGIKLGPAHDRDAIPADVEAQWVSADGDVVELVLWSGVLAREGVRRAALVLRGDRAHELTAPADTDDAEVRELGAYVHEPDGAVIRARLIGDLARRLDAGMLDPHIAYLTSDAPADSPFAASFRLREVLPMNPKAISTALKKAGIGRLEIKKRGVDVDPAAFRKKLTLRGSAEATLILVRIGDRRHAILADRV
ncbi:class I SAM-dependent methyltransferase [Microbacterium sp. 13-71-7]|uniref:class I SAM-dependent methyltransferase n=1 Tax=Microbacterium sp. 13-71-7 TaxID=1970399 RepID=UPI000BD3D67D|nr:class I SAM-dependent methyltransferase [Microbacterium sp. 13-71-7]OZB82763.1 MAG: SAM-dependent methyltransferase [Microbacterium sp. 13-71-7]